VGNSSIGDSGAPLRRDARDNVAKLRAAAIQVFQARGLGAPLEDIAQQAGVSTGTLYNRFGSREALIDSVIQELASARLAAAREHALSFAAPWDRFADYLSQLCELQATYPAVSDVISRRYPGAHELDALCADALTQAAELVAEAQRDGSLRPDFTTADVFLLLTSNASVVSATAGTAPDAWRRSLRFVLDGLRTGAAHSPTPPGVQQ
jgi:AcrR family transcriptional regulator